MTLVLRGSRLWLLVGAGVALVLVGAGLGALLGGVFGGQETPVLGPVDPSAMGPGSLRSREGRPLEVVEVGQGATAALVVAGLHGDEPQGVRLAELLIRRLGQDGGPPAGRVVVVPRVNADGLLRGTRGNAAGVDLNRNFPTADFGRAVPGRDDGRHDPGPSPASEPETRALLDLVERYRPEMIVTLHAPLACVDVDGDGRPRAAALAEAAGLPLVGDVGYATPGSLGTYFGRERGLTVVTLELAAEGNDWERLTDALAEAIGR